MTPLLWFLAGACFGALCGVVLMAVTMMWKEANAELDEWSEEIIPRHNDWHGDHYEVRLTRHGPYDWREGL